MGRFSSLRTLAAGIRSMRSGSSRDLVILGSTGSIGTSTLDVVRAAPGRFRILALAAHRNHSLLCEQAREFHPKYVVASDGAASESFDWSQLPAGTKRLQGAEGIEQVARLPEAEVIVAAIVGSAGLAGAWAALECGKTVALANKETLVAAGPLVMQLAKERHGRIIPVDSEHSAVFQALNCGQRSEVERIVLTASGGPFRSFTQEQLDAATVEQALAHPTWQMGRKITVDSATMMNKALEIIEARWLFDLWPEQIEVAVHPQSVVHSLVEFRDGSVIAQLSPPDMRLPIQYALTWPERDMGPAKRLDFSQAFRLDFEPPDEARFPALQLGAEVARRGGTAGAVLNAANEAAVDLFLNRRIRFTQIAAACRAVVDAHPYEPQPTLARLLALDAWAREEVIRWTGC